MFAPAPDDEHFHRWLPSAEPESLTDLDPRLCWFRDDRLEVWYSPGGARPEAPKLWILGITPGWRQTQIAYGLTARALRSGSSSAQAAAMAKPDVWFAGSMRANLLDMLESLCVPARLGLSGAGTLFYGGLVRASSVLRHPVFVKGRNYTGHTPSPLRHPMLLSLIESEFRAELERLPDCPMLPLGKAVETVLDHAIAMGWLDEERVLRGFPHPSGANGHRRRQFAQARSSLQAQLDRQLGFSSCPVDRTSLTSD